MASYLALLRKERTTARRKELITYSDRIRGVTFTLLNVKGSPLRLVCPNGSTSAERSSATSWDAFHATRTRKRAFSRAPLL